MNIYSTDNSAALLTLCTDVYKGFTAFEDTQ